MPTMTYQLMHSSLTPLQFISAFIVGTIIGLLVIYFAYKGIK